MIVSRTPFRLSLGGGSTDLPSYYEKYGGFVFGVAIDMYFDVVIKRSRLDDRINFQYSTDESVASVDELKHNIGREALKITGTHKGVSIMFSADTPAGSGLGSSGSCAVGLLHALHTFQGHQVTKEILAEEAFRITQRLCWTDGKQDPYLVAVGGFTVLRIEPDGKVNVVKPVIASETRRLFLVNSLFFYSGIKRSGSSADILKEQGKDRVLEMKHRTKAIGEAILRAFEAGDLETFGKLMDEHWQVKKQMSDKISNDYFNSVYDLAKECGALGGKMIGAGGGGYFLFYCPDEESKGKVRQGMSLKGLKEILFGIDYEGTKVILDMKETGS